MEPTENQARPPDEPDPSVTASPPSPTEADWAKCKEIFLAACEVPVEQRGAFVDQQCGKDAALRQQVQLLLAADEQARRFMAGATSETASSRVAAQSGTTADPGAPAAGLGWIGRYKLLQVIGEGGFGTVYRAEQEQPMRRLVALKVIKAGMDTRAVIARFDAERQALALMDHPNIARVFDAGETENGRPYFVMELVDGIPLTHYCDNHRLTARERLELFIPICQAVQHAHQKGIIHRDLKPSNVLVTLSDGQPLAKVIDFGIAKATQARLTDQTVLTELLQMIGTPQYMSPEQAEVGAEDIDTRSDIYSLGVMLYELLTGTTPLDPKDMQRRAYAEMQRYIREVDPPRPSARVSTLAGTESKIAMQRRTVFRQLQSMLSGDLDSVVMKCLEKDRARRYDTAAGLAADLSRYLLDEPVSAVPPSRWYRIHKYVRRHRTEVAVVTIVALSLIAGTAISTYGLVREAQQRKIADQRRDEAERQRAEAQRQKEEASRQAAIAQAVGKFQGDMLSAADPEHSLGDKLTVLQTVMAAGGELDKGALKDQPQAEAAVRDTIGQTLTGLGRYDLAEPQLRKSLQLRRAALSGVDPQLAKSLNNLAQLLVSTNQLDEAETLLREALGIERKNSSGNDADLPTVMGDLATVLLDEGKLDGADALFTEALQINSKLPRGQEAAANLLHNQATLRLAQGRLNDAEQTARQALQLDRANLPAAHPLLAADLNLLANILKVEGKIAEAESLYRDALAITRKVLPAGHPDIATALNNLVDVLEDQARWEEAEPLAIEALRTYRQALPPGHPNIAVALDNLANVMLGEGKLPEAEAELREAVQIDRQALPANSPDIAPILISFAEALRAQGKLGEAEPAAKQALAVLRANLPAGDPRLATAMNTLGSILAGEGKAAEAESLLEEAINIDKKTLPADDPNLADVMNNLGTLYLDSGQLSKADPLMTETLVIFRKTLQQDNPKLAKIITNLGRLRQKQRRWSEAQTLFGQAIAIERKSLPDGDPAISGSLNDLGSLYQDQQRYTEAEAPLREALAVDHRRSGTPEGDSAVAFDLWNIAPTLERLGKLSEAESDLREALELFKRRTGATAPATLNTARLLADLLDRTGRSLQAASLRKDFSLPTTRP